MGRKIDYSGIDMNEPQPYVLDIMNGPVANREDPEPFVVWINPMSFREAQALDEQALLDSVSNPKKAKQQLRKLSRRTQLLLMDRVTKVVGYELIGLSGKRYAPTDGGELVEALLDASPEEAATIVEEVEGAINDASKLREGFLGNFKQSQPQS